MPTARPPVGSPAPPSGGVLPWLAGIAGGLLLLVWAGATAASTLTGRPARFTLADAANAAARLPSHLGDPSAAWPSPGSDSLPGPVLYWCAQAAVIAVAIAAVAVAALAWTRLTGAEVRPFGVRVKHAVAARSDLRSLAVAAPVPGRITIGRSGGRLLATEPDASLAVVGPTGCGKTAGFAIPAILEWKGPVLAVSVKADLIDATIEHRRRRGRVWVYDPSASSGQPSAAWSPLPHSRTWAGAMRVAAWMTEAAQPRTDSVTDGDYWYSQARKGLAPYLHAAGVTKADVSTLVRWIDTQEEKEVEAALLLAARVDPETGEVSDPDGERERWEELLAASVDVTRNLLIEQGGEAAALADLHASEWPSWLNEKVTNAVQLEWALERGTAAGLDPLAPLAAAKSLWAKEARLRSSVFATMENVVAGWADPGVAQAARVSDVIDPDAWLAGDNTIYVVAAAHEQARLRPVITTLVQQLIRRSYDTAATSGGRLDRSCLVLLDEAGNTAPLRDLPGYAATARSHGISFVSVWQDLSQVRAIYRDRAQTVINNHRAKLWGSGIADVETLEYVSRLIGDQARLERNVSTDVTGTGRRSVSEYHSWRRVAPADVLRRIRPGEGVLIYGSELPAHMRLRPWFSDPVLRRLAETDQQPRRRARRGPGR